MCNVIQSTSTNFRLSKNTVIQTIIVDLSLKFNDHFIYSNIRHCL